MTTRVAVVGAAAVVAAGLWAGLRADSRGDGPPEATDRATPSPSEVVRSATPSPPRRGPGDFRLRKIRVASRAELVDEIAELGFDEVMVLSIGRPVRLEHYTTDHLHLRMIYESRAGEIRLFQSDDQGITSGASVVVRGHEGVRNGEGASWVERGYILDLNPFERRFVRALRWVRTTKERT